MTALESIAEQKCPRCRKGSLFVHKTYHLKGFTNMHDKCLCCGQPFELEPSFYDGALYVSYALQVAIFVSVVVAYEVLYPDAPIIAYIATLAVLIVLLAPLVYRLSRTLWIHFFVKYDRNKLTVGCKHE